MGHLIASPSNVGNITAPPSVSISNVDSKYNFKFGSGYEVRDICTLSELHKHSDPTQEGICYGVFTAIHINRKEDHRVIVKQNLRHRNIRNEVEIFEHLQSSNTSHKSTGCIEMYGYNIDQSPSFIVLEYFGEDLASLLNSNMEHEFKRYISLKMLEAFENLHSFGVMHGDIKPSNILIVENKGITIKICDLDSAAIISQQRNDLFPYDKITKHLKYTPLWVSPEVHKNSKEYNGGQFRAALSIDTFSIGLICVMLESKNNHFSNGHVLPEIDSDNYKKALTDESYLHTHVLKIEDSNPFKHLLLNMCSIKCSDRRMVAEILREFKTLNSTTRIVTENKKLVRDQHFLQDEVISKMDNMLEKQDEVIIKVDNILECMDNFVKASASILEDNKCLRDAIEKISDSMEYMTTQQQEEHRQMKLQLNQMGVSNVSPQIELEIRSIQQKLDTLVQDTHRVPTLAIIVKKSPKGLSRFNPNNLVTDTYSLSFICAHSLQIVPCGPQGEGFVFSKFKDGIGLFLKKVSPLITVSLVLLKIAVTMYGIPLPLPNLSNLGIDASNAYLDDAINTCCTSPTLLADLSALENKLNSSDDVMRKLHISTQAHREAYEAMITFLENKDYKPLKLGLVKATSASGITQWIADNPNVIKSFHDNDGRRKPISK